MAGARRNFDAQDVTIACSVALLAQLSFVAAFSLPAPALVRADISNDNGQPIAVAITPVLKLGTKSPSKLPAEWQRRRPAAAKSQSAVPSPQAEKTLEAIPKTRVADAGMPTVLVDAGRVEPSNAPEPPESGASATVASAEGSEQGAANGTETDPLKARAQDMYKAQLAAWFQARFQIAGKIPFEKLKTLQSVVSITVTEDRKMGTFSVAKPSGDPTFDAEVQSTLERIQSGGVELPAPPPMYPEMLGKSLTFRLRCSDQRHCE
ncbi:MAG: TonB C-terminal domain-containing protein [Polyangiaceae bacterium]